MHLWLPENIPVAAVSLAALTAKGKLTALPGFPMSQAVVLVTKDESDPRSIWAAPTLRSYLRVWKAAQRANLADALFEYGENTDVDHIYPKSWALRLRPRMAYVRLGPAWAEVNRSAGAGREKSALKNKRGKAKTVKGIVYAEELQLLKILGLHPGTTANPNSIFEIEPKKKRSKSGRGKPLPANLRKS